ncbi:MAG: DUF3127 domain-containing protein [Bacteroidales bacterium]|nr:DUF3127 domain-containing protein [Candidatus Sodaliphilus aphodohippi]
MEVQGKVILKLPLQSGVSKNGNNWSKQEYVLETMDSFPKKVHFDFFGDRINQYPLEVGQIIKLSFDIESREFNGRWYTSIRGWKAEDAATATPASAPGPQATAPVAPVTPAPASAPAPEVSDFGNQTAADDLPF